MTTDPPAEVSSKRNATSVTALLAIGWVVTESAGIDVANQFTVFGALGSVVFGILSGLLLMAGKRIYDREAA